MRTRDETTDPAAEELPDERALCPDCDAELGADGSCAACEAARASEEEPEAEGADDADEAERRGPAVMRRAVSLQLDRARLAARAEGDDRIPVCFSSEAAVLRYDWWEGERYYEVLDHASASVDMTYARVGLPFILDHNTREVVGRVEEIAIDDDRRGRGMLRLSRSQRGQEIRQDIEDGIRPSISFGYLTGEHYTQTGGEREGDIPTRRYTRWTPMEVSSVAIPADPSVGIGRSADSAAPRRQRSTHRPAPQARETPVRDTPTAAQNGAAPQAGASSATSNTVTVEERNAQFLEIRRMCRAANVDERTETGFIQRGLAPAQVALELFNAAQARAASLADVPQDEQLGITPGERREYSLGRAMIALVNGDHATAGYEREVSQQLARSLGRSTNGFLVPLHMRAPHVAGTAASGGNTVPQQMAGSIIELLRNKSVIDRLGPMRLPGLQGNVPIPRQTAGGSAAWSAENPGADVAESNSTFDQVTLSPKNILARQSYSKQLFAQSILAVDAFIREDLTTILALLYDLGCLHGTGAANQITGLYTQAGVNAVAMGGAITFPKVIDLETAIEADNAAVGSMAYVTTPEVKGKAKQTQKFAGTSGEPLWTGTADEGEMNGYRAVASNQIAKNLGAGVNEHGIVFGAFNQAIVADWGAIDITVDPYTLAGQGNVRVVAHWLVDFALRHPESFAKGTGLTAA